MDGHQLVDKIPHTGDGRVAEGVSSGINEKLTSRIMSSEIASSSSDEEKDEVASVGTSHSSVVIENGTASSLKVNIQKINGHNDQDRDADEVKGISTDLEQIWQWNKVVPPTIDRCMHEFIAEKMELHPGETAIVSWDGELTYGELDKISAQLAVRLIDLGAGSGTIVPLCFEKSMWTVVAVLAVMRCGAAFVLTDPQQPEARLRTIATEVSAKFVITSTKQAKLGSRIAPDATLITVGPDLRETNDKPLPSNLPQTPASAILYIIFTSGSTGKPKGVVISHSNYTSGAIPRAEAVGYKPHSRVLDFASYAFDVSIDCMLCTLSQGGCICVPSDESRVNDLSGAIRSMDVNMAHMTPSVARVLAADVLPSLDVLGLGGESVSAGDAAAWGKQTKVIIAYGPSECTVGCTINNDIRADKTYTSIGKGVGGTTWIVDPDDHDILTPVGGVGELLIEGPIVGVGYINEPEKTAAVFIEDPAWLSAGYEGIPKRHGRLYKTGDLVKYDPDGCGDIVFCGRKDRQVKLRGQRVELAEIEHHLKRNLPADASVAAEVITPGDKSREPTLVAFIAEHKDKQTGANEASKNVSFSPELQSCLAGMDSTLSTELPIYMIPTAYIPLQEMPLLVSCKVDRKRLQEIGLSISPKKLAEYRIQVVKTREPTTEAERKLHQLWIVFFGKEIDIRVGDNFFALGGDSLKAMKLVAAARAEGLLLTVADIFKFPTLEEMASSAGQCSTQTITEMTPLSLLEPDWDTQSALSDTAKLCNIEPSLIEDIYPCTPLQEGLMALSAKITEAYIAQRVVELPDVETAEKLKAAFESVASDSPILRTRIVQVSGKGLMQVVVKGPLAWFESANLEKYLASDREMSMGLGEPLSRFGVVVDETSGKVSLVLTIHHALYDGWSMPLIIERVNRAYKGLELVRRTPFKAFIKYLQTTDRPESENYWREKLKGATGQQFPRIPYPSYQAQSDSLLEHYVTVARSTTSTTTLATAIRGAWAIVASLYLCTDDVVIGETLTGRNAPIPGIEEIEGPLITTVPVRIRVDKNMEISEYIQEIHDQTLARIQHEHMGLQHIRRLSPDAREACELKTGIVLHPNAEDEELNTSNQDEPANGLVPAGDEEAAREALKFSSYPLMLVCTLGSEGFLTMASFDSNTVSSPQLERMLRVFGRVVQQLCGSPSGRIGELKLLEGEQNVEELWELTGSGASDFGKMDRITLENVPSEVTATWIVDPADSQRLLPIGAVGELLIETQSESALPPITNPDWHPARGQNGTLYCTGQLAMYDAQNTLVMIGQKGHTEPRITIPESLPIDSLPEKSPVYHELLSLWSRVLGLDEQEIQPSDSFFELGGDSIAAMKLVSEARTAGLEFTVAQIFSNRRLCDLTNVVVKREVLATKAPREIYESFSLLEVPHPNAFLAGIVHPALADESWKVADVLPVRPLQEVAVLGTIQLPRYSARYELIHLEAEIDKTRLFRSCQDLISSNEILRTVFINHARRWYGVVLEDLQVQIDTHEIDGDVESFSQKLCDLDIQTRMSPGSAFVKFMFVQGNEGKSCLIFKLSHAQYDEICLPPLLHQLSAKYEGRPVAPSIPFSKFVSHVVTTNIPESIPYWRTLLAGSSLTILRPSVPLTTRTPISLFKTLDISARSREITVATLPTAAWALCLSRYLSVTDVTFGEVASGRNIDFHNADTVIGPTWQYIPLRVKFLPDWTGSDLLSYIQQQHITSSRYEGMGLSEIVNRCTDWSADVNWFDSVVHQDVAHVENLEFLGGKGRLETIYPHLEPLREWKVQAFHKGDELGIEIITFEDWKAVGEELLVMMEVVIKMLVEIPESKLF